MVEEILEYIDSYVDMENATLCRVYERKIYPMNSAELMAAKQKNEKEQIGEEELKASGIGVKHYEVKRTSKNNGNNNHDASNFQDYLDKCGFVVVQEIVTSKKLR